MVERHVRFADQVVIEGYNRVWPIARRLLYIYEAHPLARGVCHE